VTEGGSGALDVRWTGAATPSPVRITVPGGLGTVDCTVADDGQFLVSSLDVQQIDPGGQVLVARSVAVVQELDGVTVTGWAQVTAYAD
jgi:hypothetical protein